MAILSYATLLHFNPDLFDDLQVPTQITGTEVQDMILLKSMELEALYPDPDAAQEAIGIWSAARIHTWQKIADALYKTYDPFINFTRDEVRTIEYDPNLENTITGSGRGFNSATMVDRNVTTELNQGRSVTTDRFHSEGDSAMYTPTDVASKETDMRLKHDIISIIVGEFLENFCLLIY